MFKIVKTRFRLPSYPVGEGPHKSQMFGPPAEFSSETKAIEKAKKLIQEGYGIKLIHPDGQEWSYEEILRRIQIAA